jgi:hypothetical protein
MCDGYGCTSNISGHSRGMLLDRTHARASSEQAWEPIAASRATFCRDASTAQQLQPDDANPNTAESMVKRKRRTRVAQVGEHDPGSTPIVRHAGIATFQGGINKTAIDSSFSVWMQFIVPTGKR